MTQSQKKILEEIYKELYKKYGPQGWWPLYGIQNTANRKQNAENRIQRTENRMQNAENSKQDTEYRIQNTANRKQNAEYRIQRTENRIQRTENRIQRTENRIQNTAQHPYHPNDFSYPKNKEQIFQIICGCILTQNTSWKQAEKAIINLIKNKMLDPKKIIETKENKLGEIIRPSGYYNQKAKKLKIISEWFINNNLVPKREELLKIKGVGPETVDSILLYAYKKPEFVIDSYTKRFLLKRNLITEKYKYDEIKKLFEDNLKKDYKLFQEYHALIVQNQKKIKKTKIIIQKKLDQKIKVK
jgi:endonuclease III related protein